MASVIVGIAATSTVHADVWELEIGDFMFGEGTSEYEYQGDHGQFLGSEVEGDAIAKTVATVNLGAVMSAYSGQSIAWITISDPGNNWYGNNPGADVDLFGISGGPGDLDFEYSYDGSNGLYQGMSSQELAIELGAVDFEHGYGDSSPLWVSVGDGGSITMNFDGWPGSGDSGSDDGDDGDSGDSEDSGDSGDSDDSGDSGDSDDSDDSAGDDGGSIIDISHLLGDPRGDVDGGILLPSHDLSDMMLRFNEIAPTAEWVRITIGMEGSSIVVVPGPMAITALLPAAGLLGRRRRR